MPKFRAAARQWALVSVIALTLGCAVARAQVQTGEISGTVTDATGASVPGATVTVTNTDTSIAREVKTDDQGRYEVSDLNIGNYQVQSQMQGFAGQTQKGFVLAVGQNLIVDFKLQVGTVSQEVTVSSAVAPQVNTTSSEVGSLVAEQQLQELPLNGRDYIQLVFLAPAVQPVEAAGSGAVFGNSQR